MPERRLQRTRESYQRTLIIGSWQMDTGPEHKRIVGRPVGLDCEVVQLECGHRTRADMIRLYAPCEVCQ